MVKLLLVHFKYMGNSTVNYITDDAGVHSFIATYRLSRFQQPFFIDGRKIHEKLKKKSIWFSGSVVKGSSWNFE